MTDLKLILILTTWGAIWYLLGYCHGYLRAIRWADERFSELLARSRGEDDDEQA